MSIDEQHRSKHVTESVVLESQHPAKAWKRLLYAAKSDEQQACAPAHVSRVDEWDNWKSVRDVA
jgi:hypothetical protein